MKKKFNPTWSDKINENNPEPFKYSSIGDMSEWHWEIHKNNPIEPSPDNNPSQYEFEAVWTYLVNKNRGFQITYWSGVRKFQRIIRGTPNLTSHTHRLGFNFGN